ncbi:aspartate kinase [Belliella baltica DSM 15883]|uniref:Aspartokinase n=1 Tax=Belliella baltica (strain DSM 15883 / CIP 108006 / LMG 21964 / BA134) TaxID=866536 RepID=I3Z4P0_BELBD|nr:aspartate kinase [Belliella baltica]AFL84208.1 aspartate kinase [Belliella baltica DSM 15883]
MSKVNVFKFGGASVKDADSIKNLFNIIFNRLQNPTIIVVSAMGKSTNALEEILISKIEQKPFSSNYTIFKDYHKSICSELFPQNHPIFNTLENQFKDLQDLLNQALIPENYDEYYDQIICYGEIISTIIIQAYLSLMEIPCIWQDARDIIATNNDFRFAKIDWELTEQHCKSKLRPILEETTIITQGFIGRESSGKTTTLGREGSDFTASILASCLQAEAVTIWKDVEGVLNADPKRFNNTIKFDELDYKEAAELTYYGASVIHPKTIKPLANLGIPLFVKSFLKPEGAGTKIHHVKSLNTVPCIVVKDNQVLVSFKVTDFTFINESHIQQVFTVLEKLKLKVNLLQTSAISISIVIDEQLFKLEKLIKELESFFSIRYNEKLQLLTVKNQNEKLVKDLMKNKEILLEQVTRTTFQIIYKPF